MTTAIGIAIVGMGWMGHEYARAVRQIPYAFPEYNLHPRLVIVAHRSREKARDAQRRHGFKEYTTDWLKAVQHPAVDVVIVTTPNMLHKEMVCAAADAKKDVFCEKPVGVTPEQTRAAADAAIKAGVVHGCGYNYRWMPAIRHAHDAIGRRDFGNPLLLQCFFYARHGDGPQGLWTWRFDKEQAGSGVAGDLLSHCVDMAHHLNGPIASVCATEATFYKRRPYDSHGGSFRNVAENELPMRKVTNEDHVSVLVRFNNGSNGFFDASRGLYGPKNPFDVRYYGTDGSWRWNLESMNLLNIDKRQNQTGGYATILSGPQFPDHRRLAPGEGISLSYGDTKIFEQARFLRAVRERTKFHPSLEQATQVADVLKAVANSCSQNNWQPVRYNHTDFNNP